MDPIFVSLLAFLIAIVCITIIALVAITFGHKDIVVKALDGLIKSLKGKP